MKVENSGDFQFHITQFLSIFALSNGSFPLEIPELRIFVLVYTFEPTEQPNHAQHRNGI